jgi:hypothetical protein
MKILHRFYQSIHYSKKKIPTMFLQFCEKKKQRSIGFRRLQNAEYKRNKRPCCLPNREMWKDCGPNTSGSRGSGFRDLKCQTPTHNNSRIAKSERKVGPTLRGFGVRDFTNSNVKCQHIATPELRKVKGKWDQHFGVSGFGILRIQMSNANI